MENIMEITWVITEQEADYIMKLIMTRPYGEVAGLVQKLVNQANEKPEVHIVGE
jgi:leucyl aminopeptidase (aminopeptidase T)